MAKENRTSTARRGREELNATLLNHAQKNGLFLEIFYTNVEGVAIDKIYQCADDGFDGIVMNPAGFSYAGYALKDCIKGAGLPYALGSEFAEVVAQRSQTRLYWSADSP